MEILIVCLVLVLVSVIVGISNLLFVEIFIDLNILSTPYFNFGVSFNAYEDGIHTIQSLVIGLFFVDVSIDFYKMRV